MAKKLTFIFVFYTVLLWQGLHSPTHANSYPPQVGVSWAWPGGKWDIYGWDWQNEEKWQSEYKPKILADIKEQFSYLAITDTSTNQRRALTQLINVPAFVMTNDQLKFLVKRYMSIARDYDIPFAFKIVGYVWWDKEGCPSCDQLNLAKDVEWWGWSSKYVWSPDFPPTNPGLWRDWGTPFKLTIPHPNFDSDFFRNRAGEKVGVLADAIAQEYRQLQQEGRQYLLTALITENEVAYGWSYHPKLPVTSLFGVNAYITRRCPNDVLACLPNKTTYKNGLYNNLSADAYITKLSDEKWRPDDFVEVINSAAQDYASFIAKIAFQTGIPKTKLISQGTHSIIVESQNGNHLADTSRVVLNEYSVPGYSFYGSTITSPDTLAILGKLKIQNIQGYAAVEYFDYGNLSVWTDNFTKLTQDPSLPKLLYLNVQNWEGLLDGAKTKNPNSYPGITLLKNYLQNWTPVCGNKLIEAGETCDGENIDGVSCPDLGFQSGTVVCTNCQLATHLCSNPVTPTCSSCQPGFPRKNTGNANCDSQLNLGDFLTLQAIYLHLVKGEKIDTTEQQKVDFNCSGQVNEGDFLLWLDHYSTLIQ